MPAGDAVRVLPRSVLLVDDHPLWRETMRKVLSRLGGAVVDEAADGREAIRLAHELRPDVIVMDLDLPQISGIEVTRTLCEEIPGIAILVLSASDERDDVIAAVQAGASGYLVKTAGAAEVIDAVGRVHVGELVFPPMLAEVVLQEFRRRGDDGSTPVGGVRATSAAAHKHDAPALQPPTPPVSGEARFELEGEFWSLVFACRVARLGDLLGLHDIATLLRVPGTEVHAIDILAARGGGAVPQPQPFRRDVTESALLATGGVHTDPILDAAAKAAYRRRVDELREEIEEAEAWADGERAARAKQELDQITRQLELALGLGGRDRRTTSSWAERARVNVTRAIARAIERIEAAHPQAGGHLNRAIYTGTYCRYDPEQHTDWKVSSPHGTRAVVS